jgi:magnesium-transporting ATPase (P-type)
MFWFLFFNSFDATYLYEYTFILGYNLFFTSLPVIVLGGNTIPMPDMIYVLKYH